MLVSKIIILSKPQICLHAHIYYTHTNILMNWLGVDNMKKFDSGAGLTPLGISISDPLNVVRDIFQKKKEK